MIEKIKTIIRQEITNYEAVFASSLETDAPLLRASVEHFLQRKGKGFRPMIVFLAAKICGHECNQATINAAVALELLHSASLIHDDVVDETYERRGMMTLNARFNNKVSVLTGDYFLSIGLQKAIETAHLEILKEIYRFAETTTKGELAQLATARDAVISETNYYDIIYKKTASLFVACARSGAHSVEGTPEQLDALTRFARLMGLCFQIRDDIFDYYPEMNVGKPSGNDIREGKITLPLLYVLRENSDPETEEISAYIMRKEFTPENIDQIIRFAKERGGIEYATSKMNEMFVEARQTLSIFDHSPYRDALLELMCFSIEREK